MINLQSAKTVTFTKMIYTYHVTYVNGANRSVCEEDVTTELPPQKCRTAIKNALGATYIVDVKLTSKGFRKYNLPFDMSAEIPQDEVNEEN